MNVRPHGIEFDGAHPAYLETGLIDRPLRLTVSADDPDRLVRIMATVVKQSVRTGLKLCICIDEGGFVQIADVTMVEPYRYRKVVEFDPAIARQIGTGNAIRIHLGMSKLQMSALYTAAAEAWAEVNS